MRKKQAELGRIHNPGLLVLSSLASGPKHGYAMIEDIQAFSGTLLEPGTLYGAITRLEAHGWIEPLPAEDRRRPYRLTIAGATVLREQMRSMERVVATLAPLALLTLAGYWIVHAIRLHRLAKRARWLHVVLGTAFLAVALLHAGV